MSVRRVNFLGDTVDDEMARRLEMLIEAADAKKIHLLDCEPFSSRDEREYIRAEIASADRLIAMLEALRLEGGARPSSLAARAA